MAIVKQIIESHKGDITFESRPGEGNYFCLYYSSKITGHRAPHPVLSVNIYQEEALPHLQDQNFSYVQTLLYALQEKP